MELACNHTPAISLLIIGDDDISRDILAAIIPKKFPRVVVNSAPNGEAGLDLMEACPPDIVITDITMPRRGGVRMADQIPSVKPDTKHIVITADTERSVSEGPGASGVTISRYLFKPVRYQDLFAAVEQCIALVAEERGDSADMSGVLADEHAEDKAEQAEQQCGHKGGGKAGYPETVDQR
jgi:YesN/AraC family two-component response regulator